MIVQDTFHEVFVDVDDNYSGTAFPSERWLT